MNESNYLEEIVDFSNLEPGTVVRRVSAEKIQQGRFVKISDDGRGLVVMDVIDLLTPAYAAEAGIIARGPDDKLFRHRFNFDNSPVAEKALRVVTQSGLYEANKELREQILELVQSSYSPEHILELKREERLNVLFVPVQEKFSIGKYAEKPDWNKIRTELFKEILDGMGDYDHITYVAFVPSDTHHDPMFYSYGTKPHKETMDELAKKPFAFKPNFGGHITIVSKADEVPRKFVVDAGADELGSGIQTSISTAEIVAENLERVYPENEYEAVAGRNAHGVH